MFFLFGVFLGLKWEGQVLDVWVLIMNSGGEIRICIEFKKERFREELIRIFEV